MCSRGEGGGGQVLGFLSFPMPSLVKLVGFLEFSRNQPVCSFSSLAYWGSKA